MSINLGQALRLTENFRSNQVMEQVVGDSGTEEKFKRSSLNGLTASQRKLCFQALDLVQNAMHSDFEKLGALENAENKVDKQIRDIGKQITGTEKLESQKNRRYSLFARPFIRIGKVVFAIAMRCFNALGYVTLTFGGISQARLCRKVEEYIADRKVAEKRKVELEGNGDKSINAIEKKFQDLLNELQNFINRGLFSKKEPIESLKKDVSYLRENDFEVNKPIYIPSINKNDFPDDFEGKCRFLLNEMELKTAELSKISSKYKEEENHLTELERELDLLTKKYGV